jgi:hypothetical protein
MRPAVLLQPFHHVQPHPDDTFCESKAGSEWYHAAVTENHRLLDARPRAVGILLKTASSILPDEHRLYSQFKSPRVIKS